MTEVRSIFDKYTKESSSTGGFSSASAPTSTSAQPSGPPKGNTSGLTGNVGSLPTAGNAWAKVIASSGPKSGQKYTAHLQAALKMAGITEDHVIILMKNFKSLPLGTTEEIDKIFLTNKEKGMKAGQEINKAFNIESTRPWIQKSEDLALFKEAVSLIRKNVTEPKSLRWGTLAQCSPFSDFKALMLADARKTMPASRETIMRRFLYNICDFKEIVGLVSLRWKALRSAIEYCDRIGWVKVEKGETVGSNVILVPYFRLKNPSQLSDVKKLAIGSDVGNTALSVSDEFAYNLSAAAAIDVTHLLQCSDVRRGQSQSQFAAVRNEAVEAVVAMMIFVINLVMPDVIAVIKAKPVNLEKTGDFFQTYQKCRGILGSTLRNLFADLFGRNAGAQTRTYESKNVAVGEVEPGHSFA